MLGALFKPKWQHKDAKVRLQALSGLGGSSPEMLQLAESDPDEAVRLEAIARLNDLPTLVKLGQQSSATAEQARQRFTRLARSTEGQDALFVEQFTWLTADKELLRLLAEDTKRDAKLRRLALAQVHDQALLMRVANEDGAQDLQFDAASRLEDIQALQQLEKSFGRSNKRLRQLVKERLAQQQEQQQRWQAIEALCADMESLGLTGKWAQDKTRQRVLQQSWKQQQALGVIDPTLTERFAKAEQQFAARLQVYEAEQAQQAPRLAVYEQCLADAATLQQALQQPDETLSLEGIDQQLAALQERWVGAQPLSAAQQANLDQRWVEQFVRLTEARDNVAGDLKTLAALQQCLQQAESMRTSEKPVLAKRLTELQTDWVKVKRPQHLREAVAALENRFQQAMSSLNARLQKQLAQRDELLEHLRRDVAQLEADLEAEKYGEAIDLHRQLTQALQDHVELPARDVADIKRRLQAATPLVMEFKDWRRWGTDQAREHLIETAQWLENDESLDPQVRAKEIKALREEWRKLAQMEPGQQRKQWKVFDSKVSAAYEISKQYFAEQATEREKHLHEREAVCAELEKLAAETDWQQADWHAVYTRVNQLRKTWKECGTVGHKEWRDINQRFNNAIDALEAHLTQERERNFALRQTLVNTAVGLAEVEVQEAVERAKQLRTRWKITVPSRPKEEQRLWKQFQAAIDAVFARLRDARQTQRSELEERMARKESLCTQVEGMAELQGEAFTQAYAELDELQKAFSEIRDLPKVAYQKLEERFRRAEQALVKRAAQVRWQRKLAELDQLAADSTIRKQMAGEDETILAAHQAQGETLCLQLELLLDLTTPENFRQARMSYQVAHLSEAMSTRRVHADRDQEALKLLKAWYGLGAMPAEALASQQSRVATVRQALAGH